VQGQSRLDFNLVQIRFADGALVTVKGKVGDKSGAVGVPGEVDNHYGKILLGAGVSALLSIGARAPFGSTDNFRASLPQQFARDVSQDINSTGQQIVKRMTDIPPTIRAKAGDEVTIQLQENVSFAKEPTLVR